MRGGFLSQEVLEIMDLWKKLIIKNVELQFSGKERITIIQRIDEDLPLAECEVTVPEKDPITGQVRMVAKRILVKDDLGNIIRSAEEFGGQCTRGEFVHKDYIHRCHECGKPFCSKHVRFLDRINRETPLCYYGFMGKDGCYYQKHWKPFIKKKDKIAEIAADTEVIDAGTGQREAKAKRLETDIRMKQLKRQKGSGGLLAGFLAPPIKCPNCDFSPPRLNVTCSQCGTAFQITKTSSRACPQCDTVKTSTTCKCGETIYF